MLIIKNLRFLQKDIIQNWKLSPDSFTTSILSRLKSTQSIKWLWKADTAIQEYHRADLQGTRRGVFHLTLNSVTSLPDKHFHDALVHLQKNSPLLQTCIMYRGEEIWYCQPHNLEVDFKVEKMDSVESVMEIMMTEKFDTPRCGQWRTRLVPLSPDIKCPMPELGEKYPYQYSLLITAHHGLTDALDFVLISKHIHKFLNDTIAGNPHKDGGFETLSFNEDIPEQIRNMKEKLLSDHTLYETVQKTLPPPGHTPLLLQAFPRPKVSKASTKHITRVIDSQVIKNFQLKSKEAGVTFGSALVTILNTAVTELVREKGIEKDLYNIASHNYIGYRRYMKPSKEHIYGLSSSPMSFTVVVRKDIRDNFWAYCQETHKELQSILENRTPLLQKAFRELVDEDHPPPDYLTNIRPAIHEYTLTNIGDMSPHLPGEGEYVQITRLETRCKIHNSFNSTLHEIYFFRGQSYYTLDYDTSYFADDTANLLLDKIISLLEYYSR